MNLHAMETRLKELYAREGRLLSLHLDLLYRCDLDCTHCYLDDKRTRELDTEKICALLQEARDLGVLKLTLSGGELLLRRDLFTILEEAQRLRFFLKLKTHAGRVGAPEAAEMKRLGVRQVDVSVYALDPTPHDCITRRPGSLAATLRGIEHLLEAGVAVKVRCTVMETNKSHYETLYETLTSRGIPCTLDGAIRAANSGSRHVCEDALSPEDHLALEVFKMKRTVTNPASELRLDPVARICQAGHTSLYVQPDGKVTPCVAWPMAIGDLHEQRLTQIWHEAPALSAIQSVRRQDRIGCGGCSFEHACLFCPGKAWMENHGEAYARHPDQCEVTEAKEHARLVVLRERVAP